MDFYDILLKCKTGVPCNNFYDGIFAGDSGGGGKPALVPWSTGTDEEIVAMVNGYYEGTLTIDEIKSVWSLGDCRSVNLAAMTPKYVSEIHRAQKVELQILDFEHDDLTTAIGDKTKALITVDLKDCLRAEGVSDTGGSSNSENGYINYTGGNAGGWTSCKRREWCNEIFYNALPTYIKNIVKAVNKLTSAGSQSETINSDSDFCFLLSEIEVFGIVTYSKNGEGAKYHWFSDISENRYKLPKWNSDFVSDSWWLRSPYNSNNSFFCYFSATGNASNSNSYNLRGIAPAFCL